MSNDTTLPKRAPNKLAIPRIIILIGTALMVASLFLPFAVAIGDRATALEEFPDEILPADFDVTSRDLQYLSFFGHAKAAREVVEMANVYPFAGYIYLVIVSIIGGLAASAFVFGMVKKPIGTIISAGLSLAVFIFHISAYSRRGGVPSSQYRYGMAYYLFFVATAITFVGALWMLLKISRARRISEKNQARPV